jgi:2-dehydropantoate 2-reductase
MSLRLLVAGAGALGSVFGGFLAEAGHQVTLLGRAPHLAAITSDGLLIEGLWGTRRVAGLSAAVDASELRPPYDAILLTVKSYDTAPVLRAVAATLAADGCVLSLQNGLGNLEQVAAAVGPARAIAGRVIFGAVVPRPGVAQVTVCADPVAIGAATPGVAAAEAHARAWAERIAATPITAEYTRDVSAHLWMKVFYNAALNPLGALFGVPYGALADDAGTREVMDAIIDEGYAVAAARGIVPVVPTAPEYRELFYGRLVPSTAHHRSSMLQDLERGRATEIGAINGRIWAYGRDAGIETPINATMTRLVRWRERIAGAGERD